LLRHRQVAIGRSSNTSGVALVDVATPTTIAKAYDAMPRFCKSKTHFPTLSRKVLSKTLPTQASATPPNKKSVSIFDIATILGLLQHISGVETGSKFSSIVRFHQIRCSMFSKYDLSKYIFGRRDKRLCKSMRKKICEHMKAHE
jgi:hypothetical protein